MSRSFRHGSGVETVFHLHNDNTGDITFETKQDAEPILEAAKRLHREGIHGSKDMRHAAHFPAVLIEKYCNMKGITFHEWLQDKKHVRAMLNDPDLANFRIWRGAV